jgi:hypothetical protein
MIKLVGYTTPRIISLPFQFSYGYFGFSFGFLVWNIIVYTNYEDIQEKQIAEVKRQVAKIIAKRKEKND